MCYNFCGEQDTDTSQKKQHASTDQNKSSLHCLQEILWDKCKKVASVYEFQLHSFCTYLLKSSTDMVLLNVVVLVRNQWL